jgi:hypothetical protein
MVDRLAAKHGLRATKKPEVRDYKEELCPHCHKHLPVATNIRFWSSQELRELADLVQKNEEIAAANRESRVCRRKGGSVKSPVALWIEFDFDYVLVDIWPTE